MFYVDRITIIKRFDEEEEGDMYYEYRVMDENNEVVEGSRWVYRDSESVHFYYAWLESRDFKIVYDCKVELI